MALVAKLQDENRRVRDELERNKTLHNESDLNNPIETICKYDDFLIYNR